jgi:hypothetical protein
MLFPYVNESAFWETYHRFSRSGKKKIRNSWLGLLNMILAMATSTGTRDGQSMQDRYSQSEIYFNRAKALCLDHMLSGASIETGEISIVLWQREGMPWLIVSSPGHAAHDAVSSRDSQVYQDLGHSRSRS